MAQVRTKHIHFFDGAIQIIYLRKVYVYFNNSIMRRIAVTSVKGTIHFRECDHQAENPGFVVEVKAGTDGNPEPQLQSIFDRKISTPDCGKTTFSS